MNYFPFHIGDYASHTRHLSWEEDAAYRRLLDVYYTTEKPLPLDPKACCRLVLATTESQREAVATVLAEFFQSTDEGWRHGRADEEIEAMRDKQATSEERDQHEKERMRRHRERRAELFEVLRNAGVVPAWDTSMKELQRLVGELAEPATDPQRAGNVAGNAPATAISTNTNTNTNTKDKEIPPNPPRGATGLSKFPPGFEAFWNAYPRKIGKDAAIKAFAKRRFTEDQRRLVIAAVERQREWEQWTREGGQFIPHPATWLNEGRWQDEPAALVSSDRFSRSAI